MVHASGVFIDHLEEADLQPQDGNIPATASLFGGGVWRFSGGRVRVFSPRIHLERNNTAAIAYFYDHKIRGGSYVGKWQYPDLHICSEGLQYGRS
jgi:hypothetical protein